MRESRQRSRTPPCKQMHSARLVASGSSTTPFLKPKLIAPACRLPEFLRDGDVLAVWRLDRLGRSLPHLIEVISALDFVQPLSENDTARLILNR